MAASATLRADEAEYISAKLREGKFIIDAIEHRKQTLLKIAFAILSLQPEFFEKGKSALKPMTMQEVADIVGSTRRLLAGLCRKNMRILLSELWR